MTAILGISAFYHDSAATLVVDGEISAAAHEERFTRVKHDESFPANAIAYCMQEAGLTPSGIDYVVYYEKPLRKFERILRTFAENAPLGYRSFRHAIPKWITEKLHVKKEIRNNLGEEFHGRILFADHHESHAASAFYPSPFDEAAILTIDGVGEWSTTCRGVGKGNHIELCDEIRFPHSLGLLYSAFTYYCGFRVNSGEYKVMGLAPLGEPNYFDLIMDNLIQVYDDGSFQLDLSYFNYHRGLTMTSNKFHRLFGDAPRSPESEITQKVKDIAASIQRVTEEIVLRMATNLHATTNNENLVLAGGVALNCVANGRLSRESPFKRIWAQPASGDAGGSLGAALLGWHQILDNPRPAPVSDTQHGSRLGPQFSEDAIREFLDSCNAKYVHTQSSTELGDQVANHVNSGKTIGWFQGRMEFGPRALGSRSILADARSPEMQTRLNVTIKNRESFRPFAPIVLAEEVSNWFDVPSDFETPYMSFVAPVRCDPNDGNQSPIPAVTHVDGTARLQTVDQQRDPLLHQLLVSFQKLTGCPVMINTSFNVRGEPVVCTPKDAWRCFIHSGLDVLVLGPFIVVKQEQPPDVISTSAIEPADIILD